MNFIDRELTCVVMTGAHGESDSTPYKSKIIQIVQIAALLNPPDLKGDLIRQIIK